MTLASPSGLETLDYGVPAWHAIFNRNWELLNDLLLKVDALQDVLPDNPQDGDVLVWNGATSKWTRRQY